MGQANARFQVSFDDITVRWARWLCFVSGVSFEDLHYLPAVSPQHRTRRGETVGLTRGEANGKGAGLWIGSLLRPFVTARTEAPCRAQDQGTVGRAESNARRTGQFTRSGGLRACHHPAISRIICPPPLPMFNTFTHTI